MSVGSIDNYGIHSGVYQSSGSFDRIGSNPQSGSHSQTTKFVFVGIWFLGQFGNIPKSNQANQLVFGIDNGQFFDFMSLQNHFGLFQRCSFGNGNQVFACHYFDNRSCIVFFETQIPVGHDSFQNSVLVHNWNTTNTVFFHCGFGVGNSR